MSFSMSREDINYYFSELGKELKRSLGRDIRIELIVVGGAAVALNYHFRDATTDIDAYVPSRISIKDVIHRVGDKYGLNYDWINQDFVKSASYSPKIVEYSRYYKTYSNCLTVRTVGAEYLVAMKMKSFRPYKHDRSDIVGIVKEEMLDDKQVISAYQNLYGELPNHETEMFIRKLMQQNSMQLDDEYTDEKEIEESNQEILVEFNGKYKGVLKESNLDVIIERIKKLQEREDNNGEAI